jgi:hypothetical protein
VNFHIDRYKTPTLIRCLLGKAGITVLACSCEKRLAMIPVFAPPGEIAFTRTPCPIGSKAKLRDDGDFAFQ